MCRSKPETVPTGYSRVQITLHWGIALLVLAQLTINEDVRRAFGEALNGEESNGTESGLSPYALFHIGAGLAVLVLLLLRIGLRVIRGVPEPPKGAPALIRHLGEWAHRVLYLLLLLMTLSGAAAWFLTSETAARLHEIGRLMLIALILAHVMGALVEHFIFGNHVLRRMIRAGDDADRTGSA